MTSAFQPNAFQNDAYQVEAELIAAFQPCAFQDDAFQTTACPTPPVTDYLPGGAGYPHKHSISAYVLPTGRGTKKRIDDFINENMLDFYKVAETLPRETQKKVDKLVKPYVEKKHKKEVLPEPVYIDWAALEKDAQRVLALLALWEAQVQEWDDEEALLLLI